MTTSLLLLTFAAGVALIVWGAETFAEHLGRASVRLGVSSFALALLLAGAEPEELATAVVASLRGSPGIALGDVVGANVTICLVALGVGAWIAPLPFRAQVMRYTLFGLPLGAIGAWFAWDGMVGRSEGAIRALDARRPGLHDGARMRIDYVDHRPVRLIGPVLAWNKPGDVRSVLRWIRLQPEMGGLREGGFAEHRERLGGRDQENDAVGQRAAPGHECGNLLDQSGHLRPAARPGRHARPGPPSTRAAKAVTPRMTADTKTPSTVSAGPPVSLIQ